MEGRPPNECVLAERARSGDERAFEELVRTYQGIAFRTAYLLTGSAADAEEAAQTAFVKAWRALPRFRSGRAVQAVAPAHRRERGPQPAPVGAVGATRCGCARPRPILRRTRPRLRRGPRSGGSDVRRSCAAVEPLGERDRDVLACRYFLELTEEETAEVLGVRRGTVKSRTARALERLREEVEA